jgi:hypothetical protein
MTAKSKPWLEVQGHAPYAWSVLGAAAQATEQIPLMSYVSCPIGRYHPAVVAQKAATMQLLSDGRFTLGLGAGENLNEHIVGGRWPLVGVRHQMLAEAVEIIRALWAGGTVTYRGRHFEVESARSGTCRRSALGRQGAAEHPVVLVEPAGGLDREVQTVVADLAGPADGLGRCAPNRQGQRPAGRPLPRRRQTPGLLCLPGFGVHSTWRPEPCHFGQVACPGRTRLRVPPGEVVPIGAPLAAEVQGVGF